MKTGKKVQQTTNALQAYLKDQSELKTSWAYVYLIELLNLDCNILSKRL